MKQSTELYIRLLKVEENQDKMIKVINAILAALATTHTVDHTPIPDNPIHNDTEGYI